MSRAKTLKCKLPYPELPHHSDPLFSLAWYFRKQAERDALDQCFRAECGRKRNKPVLTLALAYATRALELNVNNAILGLAREGLLPFAWAGTTAFDLRAVAA